MWGLLEAEEEEEELEGWGQNTALSKGGHVERSGSGEGDAVCVRHPQMMTHAGSGQSRSDLETPEEAELKDRSQLASVIGAIRGRKSEVLMLVG